MKAGANPVLGRDIEIKDQVWRRFALTFLGAFFGALGVILLLIIIVDPYDSGRFPSIGISGASEEFQRPGNVGLARAPQFNAAIFGNSHGQLLSPARLSALTGLSFVQLTVPGANVREQLATMRWFTRHHAAIGALVMAVEERWCVSDPALPVRTAFPFWLYSDSNLVYLANVLSVRSIRDGFRRVMFGAGLQPPTDAAGYSNYEVGKVWSFKPDLTVPRSAGRVQSDVPEPHFPALERLDELLAGLPKTVPIVIVMPPQFVALIPIRESGAEQARNICKAAIARRVRGRARSGLIDFLVESPITRNPENFMDEEHYRTNVAIIIEQQIAAVLNDSRQGSEANR
jgi:hypothetical protein